MEGRSAKRIACDSLAVVGLLVALLAGFAPAARADFTYSSEFGGPTAIGSARQIAIGPSGTIYVGDSTAGHNAIDEFDSQGNFIGAIGPAIPGYPGGSNDCASGGAWCFLLFNAGVATDAAGNIYVADNGNQRVIKLSPSGQWIATIGPSFTDPTGTADTLGRPNGLAVQGSNLFVVDSGTNSVAPRVIEFSTGGTPVRIIGGAASGTPGDGTFVTPNGIAVDPAGNIYVSDSGSQLVQKFDSAGNFLTQWGSQTPTCSASSSADGCLGGGNVGPQQLATDANGNVFVTDTNHYQIQEFTSDGTYVTKFGAVAGCPPVCPTEPQQLVVPYGIATEQVGGSTVVLVSDLQTGYLTRWIPAAVQPPATPLPPPLPPPVLGKAVDVTPVSGLVFIKPPPGKTLAGDPTAAAAQLGKGQGFVPLTEARQIPTGSQIDALQGSLKLVTATGNVGKTQNGTFGGAIFTISQDRTGITKGLTNLALQESAFRGAPTYATCKPNGKGKKAADQATTASLSSRTLQLLKANAHGKFKTTGRYSSATVRGTIWTIADRCDGTLTHAIRDTVLIQDFVRHRTILLHAGNTYLARAVRTRK